MFTRHGWGPPLIIIGGLLMLLSGGLGFQTVGMSFAFGGGWGDDARLGAAIFFLIFMLGVWMVRRGWKIAKRQMP